MGAAGGSVRSGRVLAETKEATHDANEERATGHARGNRPARPQRHVGVPDLRPAGHRQDHQPHPPDSSAPSTGTVADSMLVTSFSRAAAAELAGRDLPIAPDRVGTLHSHCWHALGGPEIAESKRGRMEPDNPRLAITPAKKQGKLDGEECRAKTTPNWRRTATSSFEQLSRFRGLMLPQNGWPVTLREFEAAVDGVQAGKRPARLHRPDRDVPTATCAAAPKNPSVIFADEAQDLNRMQLSLIRKWGERANYFIVAGDDDQTIYSFTGATPEAILDPDIPDDHKIILKQSYRVPRAVHRLADDLIRQVTRRQEKEYLPRQRMARPPALARHVQVAGVLHPQERRGAPGAGQDRDVPGVLLVHAPAAGRGAPQARHPVPQPVPQDERLLEPAADRHEGVDRQPDPLPAGGASGVWRGPPPVDERRPGAWASGCRRRASCATASKRSSRRSTVPPRSSHGAPATIFEPAALESLMAAWDGDYRDLLDWWRTRVTADVSQPRPVPGGHCRHAGAARAPGNAASGRRHDPLGQGRPGRRGVSLSGSQPGWRRAVRPGRRGARLRDPSLLRGADAERAKRSTSASAKPAWRSRYEQSNVDS